MPRPSSPAASLHRTKLFAFVNFCRGCAEREREMENAESKKLVVCAKPLRLLGNHTDNPFAGSKKIGSHRPSGEPEARDRFHCDRRLFAPSRRNTDLQFQGTKEDMRHKLSVDRHALTSSVVGNTMQFPLRPTKSASQQSFAKKRRGRGCDG